MTVSFIGGDLRSVYAASFLAKRCAVRTYGLPPPAPCPVTSLYAALAGAEVAVLPLPVTRDGIFPCFLPDCGLQVPDFVALFSRAEEETLFLGGAVPPALIGQAKDEGLTLIDYYTGERILQNTARATAEAAIALAITEAPFVLEGCAVSLIGFGRIAGALLPRLLAFGARVTVFARSEEALACARAGGAETVRLTGEGLVLPPDTRILFNTVPAPLLDAAALAPLAPDCLVLDLAGGALDTQAADAKGLRHPHALGLPGKFSPESAGRAVFEEILFHIATKRGIDL